MWDAQWAVRASRAVIELFGCMSTMAVIAVICWATSEECLRAAQTALPSDVLVAVLGAIELSAANLLDRALLADKVLFLRRLRHVQVSLAISLSTKERLLALVAFVKCALFICIQRVDQLIFNGFLGHLTDLLFQIEQLLKFWLKLGPVAEVGDRMFAGWAGHEVE